MSLDEKIAEFLSQAAPRPAASKLEPYYELIRTLRQRRWTYQRIAVTLRDDFQVKVAVSSIHSFMKVRSRRASCGTMKAEQAKAPVPQVPVKRPRFNLDA